MNDVSNDVKQCILHIGMPKTGTSSLQESLFYGLADPAFRYIGLGGGNSTAALATLFSDKETHYSHRQRGRSTQQVQQYRMQWLGQLDNALTHIGADVRPILSAEYCWRMNRMEFERVRDFMAGRGYTIQIVAYIRPWKQWLESSFTERIKLGQDAFQIAPRQEARLDYRGRIETVEAVFGADQVQVFKYDPGIFPAGCVVRHFCQQMGIHLDPDSIRRANDSLKLPAIQLLYAYRKFGPGYGTGATAVAENAQLNRRLRELGGPALHFHSAAVEPVISKLLPQIPWLEQRLGLLFVEDITQHDHDTCIRSEADLFDFDGEALAWLAAAVHRKPVSPATGEAAARAVAAQMHTLRRSVPAHVRARWLMRGIINGLRRRRV
jgi:hypothetical protein